MENKEEKYIENEVNKKTLETDDIYIENPTNEINNKKLKSHKIKLLYLIIPIIIVIIGIVYLVNFYKENGTINIFSYTVKKEELVEMLKQYDNAIYLQEETAKVGAIIDYDYNEYDKLLTYSCIYKNEQTTLEAGGIVLINSNNKNFKFISFDMSNMGLIYYLIANNEKNKLTEVSKILGKYIKENQTYEINETKNRENYMAMGKEIGKVVGVTLCREIGEDYMRRYTVYQEGVTDLLYKKDEIYSRYIGIPTTEQEYCWTIIPEETAKLYYNINRKTYNTLVALYGQPYKTVQKYSVFESGDGEEAVLVKSYDSKEEAKRDLGVEELGDHNSYTYTEDKTNSTDNNENYNKVNSTDTVIQENDDEDKENNTQKEEQDITKEENLEEETSKENSDTIENSYEEETTDSADTQNNQDIAQEDNNNYVDEMPNQWSADVEIDAQDACFDYNGQKCYVYNYGNSPVGANYFCYLQDPSTLTNYELSQLTTKGRGIKYYINDKYVGDSSSFSFNYTFTKNENITLTIVAPYIYDFETKKTIATDVIVYEATDTAENFYKNRHNEANPFVSIPLPSI